MNRFTRTLASLLLGLAVALPASLPLAVPDASASCNLFSDDDCGDASKVNYCNSNDPNSSQYCDIDKGTEIVKNGIQDIQKERKFSEYVQDVTTYLMYFLGIVGVLFLIWAGFTIMTSSGDEDAVKKAKGTIKTVGLWLLLIFLASSIINFFVRVVNAPAPRTSFEFLSPFGTAHAAAVEDQAIQGTFQEYKKQIDEVTIDLDRQYKVDGKIKDATLLRLKALIVGTMDTVADKNASSNGVMAQSVITAIEVVRKDPGNDAKIGDLASTLISYIKGAKVDKIEGKATATPQKGNAPLTVSLRADGVRDPSGVVIPSRNYVWWIKTPGGRSIIGTGPSVAYTFREERNYTVFLDVLSASRNSKGKTDVLPLQTSVDVNVLPKLGNIILYINGTNVSSTDKHKITPASGRAGIIIDATASQANGGSKFVRTDWDFGNSLVLGYDGSPRLERQSYSEGTYRIKLRLKTNENETVTKEIDLQVMDPMASIKAEKTEGFANEEFKFRANPNIGGAVLSYEWDIMESDGGKVLYTSKVSTASYKFPRMGRYVVRLKTLTPSGKQDVDTLNVTINSKDPVAVFDIRTTGQESPNTMLFDASKSYDPDSLEASKLEFAWNIDGERVELKESQRAGAIGKYTFSTLGNHKVTLSLTNEQGKTTNVTRDVEVTSLLSVKLSMSPKIVVLGSPVNFIAESKEAGVFEWNFNDGGSTEITSNGRVSHTYKKAGTYDVTLTVRGSNAGGQNSITRKVYVTEANAPFALIGLKVDSNAISPTPGACGDNEAFVINRVKPSMFTAEDSVNVDGNPGGLTYSWKYAGKTSSQRDFSYKFDELGCFPVTLTVRSQKNGKTSTMQTYVKVENVLPTFSTLSITEDKPNSDPVIVRVTANGAIDEDGVITSYLWYYYTDSDPEPQDFRVTRTPSTAFVLPRINGKYYFAVTMEDSNGEKVNSDDQRTERYSLSLVTDNINTPLISLKADNTNVNAGDKVKFDAIVKNVLGSDISGKSEYKWDFDGDGFYDETTDKPTVSHSYDKPGNFNMKVKVTYKGISNTRYQSVNVKSDLRPSAEVLAIGRKFVFLNTTPPPFQSVKWSIGNGMATSDSKDSFTYEFGEDDDISSISATMEVSDGKDTKSVEIPIKKDVANELRFKKSSEKLEYLTFPEASDGTVTVDSPGQSVFVYLGESKDSPAKFVIDTDTDLDSDLNGQADDDADNKGTDSYSNGSPFVIKDLAKGHKNRTVRLTTYDASGKVIASKEIKIVVSYLKDEEAASGSGSKTPEGLSDSDKANLEKLKDLIRTKIPEKDRMKVMQQLSSLQENWFDSREKTRIILDMETTVGELKLDQSVKDDIYSLLEGFLVSEDQTKDDVALAVKVLKSLIPESNAHYKEIVGDKDKPGLVDEILSHPANTELNREIGKKILDYVKDDKNIENKDKLIIKSQLEVIIYGGQANVPAASKDPETAPEESSGGFVSFIIGLGKIIAVIFGIIFGLFILLFVFFKVTNRNPSLGFQDFIIEKLFGNGGSSAKPASPKPTAPTPPAQPVSPAPASVPPKFDPLASVPPVAPTPVSVPEASVAPRAQAPDVAKFDPLASVAQSASSQAPSAAAPIESEAPLPAWLKGSSLDSSAQKSPLAPDTPAPRAQAPDVAKFDPLASMSQQTSENELEVSRNAEDREPAFSGTAPSSEAEVALPSWLTGASSVSRESSDGGMSEEPASEEPSSASPFGASWTKTDAFGYESEISQERIEPEVESHDQPVKSEPAVSQESDDLPDWLKGIGVAEVAKETEEELSTPSKLNSPSDEPVSALENLPLAPQSPESATDDLPEWLRPASQKPAAFVAGEAAPIAPVSQNKEKTTESSNQASAQATPVAPPSDDLPDWLKNVTTR